MLSITAIKLCGGNYIVIFLKYAIIEINTDSFVKKGALKMKIVKKYKCDFESYGVTEENGYVKWYFWDKVKVPSRVMGTVLILLLFVFTKIFSDKLFAYGKAVTLIASLAALATLIIVVVPIHEFLHLLVMAKGKLDDRCVITAGGGAVSAVYEGHISRNRQLVCFAVPFLFFAVIISLAIIISSGAVRIYFVYLFIMSCISSYTDIFMIFYTLKNVKKNELIFGIYKKESL